MSTDDSRWSEHSQATILLSNILQFSVEDYEYLMSLETSSSSFSPCHKPPYTRHQSLNATGINLARLERDLTATFV
jgi:hypothetical protein